MAAAFLKGAQVRTSQCARRTVGKVLPFALAFTVGSTILDGAEPDFVASTTTQTTTTETVRWKSERQAFAGPLLDPAWFAKRRVIVYLMPEAGDLPAIRRAAALIMRDRWLEGDWTLKHLVVSDVGRIRFVARQRVAVHDIAQRMTEEAGQEPDFAPENENYVRQNLFFLHDPEREVWRELIGDGASLREGAVVMLDYGGKVVRVMKASEALQPSESSDDGLAGLGQAAVVEKVRVELPSRLELGG